MVYPLELGSVRTWLLSGARCNRDGAANFAGSLLIFGVAERLGGTILLSYGCAIPWHTYEFFISLNFNASSFKN